MAQGNTMPMHLLDAREKSMAAGGMFEEKDQGTAQLMALYDISYMCFNNSIEHIRLHVQEYNTFKLSDQQALDICLHVVRVFSDCSMYKAKVFFKMINIMAFRLIGEPSFSDCVRILFRLANENYDEMDAICKVLRRSIRNGTLRYQYPLQSATIISCLHFLCKRRWQKKRSQNLINDTRVYLAYSESIDFSEWRTRAEHYRAHDIFWNNPFPTI